MGISSVRDSGAGTTAEVGGWVPSRVVSAGRYGNGVIFSVNAKHVDRFLLAQIAYCCLLLDT
jgi:hypothetical protein